MMPNSVADDYRVLAKQLDAMLADEPDPLANTANFVGLLYNEIPDINWLGIYVWRGEELVLGPFQGRPACVRILPGHGVCGTAAEKRETLRIADVHTFEGHIVCDAASRSEIVVPLMANGRLLGVLDVDSPMTNRFSEVDQQGIEYLCNVFVSALDRYELRSPGFI